MNWVKKEFLRVFPIFLFFLGAFYLLNMTISLMLRKTGLQAFSFGQVLVAALVIAKVFLILDNLPFINAFSGRPLIYKISWKVSLYSIGAIVIHLLGRLLFFLWETPQPTLHGYLNLFDWPKFCSVQIWFFVLIFQFVMMRELTQVIGTAKMRRIFLGR